VGVESGGFGPQLSTLVGLLSGTYPLSYGQSGTFASKRLGSDTDNQYSYLRDNI
jgi:hypothetical protein